MIGHGGDQVYTFYDPKNMNVAINVPIDNDKCAKLSNVLHSYGYKWHEGSTFKDRQVNPHHDVLWPGLYDWSCYPLYNSIWKGYPHSCYSHEADYDIVRTINFLPNMDEWEEGE